MGSDYLGDGQGTSTLERFTAAALQTIQHRGRMPTTGANTEH